MANLNKVLLMGNITRDLELKYLPNQTAVCDIGLAVNRTWTGADGIKKEEVTFVDCSVFGKQAEILAKYKKKGDPLFIEGRLKLDQWDAQDGTKRYKMRVVVENFQFLNRSQGNQGGAPAGDYESESSAAPRQQFQPRNAAPQNRAPANAGRPAPQQAAPNYDAGDVMPQDDGPPPVANEDIPF